MAYQYTFYSFVEDLSTVQGHVIAVLTMKKYDSIP